MNESLMIVGVTLGFGLVVIALMFIGVIAYNKIKGATKICK